MQVVLIPTIERMLTLDAGKTWKTTSTAVVETFVDNRFTCYREGGRTGEDGRTQRRTGGRACTAEPMVEARQVIK